MKTLIFVVRDRAANCFGQPFFVQSKGLAIRSFSDAINGKGEEMLQKHPEDFDLYELGCYFDDTGRFEVSAPVQIAIGKDLKINGG